MRYAHGVARELLLARFEKVLAPAIVEVGGNALAAAQLRDALLTAQPFEDDPDLSSGANLLRVRRRISRTADSVDCFFVLVISRLSPGSRTP